MRDTAVFADEQQRHYVTTDILMAAYFKCRPVSMFDTSSSFPEDDTTDPSKLVDHVTVAN